MDKAGFYLVEDMAVSPQKRWVVISPASAQNPIEHTCVVLARANTPEQRAAIGQQTGGRVGFFLHSTDFEADYTRMRKAGVVFEETPRYESYGTVAVWRDPWGNRWDLLQLK